MTEKEIESQITEKINQGTEKSILYKQFKDVIKDEKLRRILASIPSYESRQRFKKMHISLSVIWGLFILLELGGILDLAVRFDILYFISLVVSIYIAVNICRFDGRFMIIGIIWFALTILNSFGELVLIYQYEFDSPTPLILLALYYLILAYGIYLMYVIKNKVFSYIGWFQPILNREGYRRFE